MKNLRIVSMALLLMATLSVNAEDGRDLWLRLPDVQTAQITCSSRSATATLAADELRHYWRGSAVNMTLDRKMPAGDGFTIKTDRRGTVQLTAPSDAGLLYGAYELLRRQQTGQTVGSLTSYPQFDLRILNHWDNLDGSIERGYAGRSIFWGDEALPTDADLLEYARANASVGINGTVLNNVNASPQMLSTANLLKVKRIAEVLRPWHIKVYLSVNFASPMGLGGLKTADPLDAQVQQWWKEKTAEVYRLIPDFGGYLVKANSEGQPGPGDYHRTHAEGANMLADALAPYGGIVMWRSFVYGYHPGVDRVKQAVDEFRPLDGQFRPNVILQIKNGPLDFQPREPYSPLFDQMKHTPMMAELQITQEYLGQSRHLVYLAPMWNEFFGFVSPKTLRGVAGVANIGNDRNWCGHHFSQANWYCFGRQAWDASLTPEQIAREWLQQTFSLNDRFVTTMTDVMLRSREACVDYMMPLGLHHIFMDDHHYGPYPEGNRADFPDAWKPVWYHKAAADGIGFNRSSTGTNAVEQYREPYRTLYDDVATCPEQYLLWFHHLPWTYQMHDGTTLWQSLCAHYRHGVAEVDDFMAAWRDMQPFVDDQRYREVEERLLHQQENAREWCNHCLDYFRQFSGMPVY